MISELREKTGAGLLDVKKALDGLAIPLHPGAERYYKEVGLL